MPRPLPGDLVLFARVLAARSRDERARAADLLLRDSEVAERHRLTFNTCHPKFGDGSLVSRLMREPLPALTFGDDPDLLHALQVVARSVLKHTAP
jgi:hypothetical protein